MRMSRVVGALAGAFACSLSLFASTLEEAFDTPPQSAGAYAWWHWCGGNVSEAGITRDLGAMKRAGLAGATIFHVDSLSNFHLATNVVTAGMTYRSPTWWRMMRFAADEARRLGLELGYCNSAGYSCSGGPWITPELSMKKLVWTKAPKGGRPAQPETVRGFYREIAEVVVGETVYRIGYTSTGKCVHPAPAEIEESALEADKMSAKIMNLHWDHAIDEVVRNLGGASRPGLTHVLMDSYEAGDHDWTDDFADQFAKRRGYDPVPLLPYLLDGTLPPNPRFAEDFRLTKEELLTENHYELFKCRANAAGLEMHLEPYTGPFDGIVASTIPDVPMTEFWGAPVFWAPEESRFGGDVWFCGPAARAVGHTIIGAESFTAMPQDDMWTMAPRHLKRGLDATYARGVNRISLHHWVHQPLDPKWAPGFTMGFWGTHFGECQTWFEPAIGFYRYMQRCQALCQRGEEVVDTLSVNEGFPTGQKGDTIPTKVFLSDAVEVLSDGTIRLPSGRTYRYLREPWSYAPSAAVSNRIAALVKKGARLWTPECEKRGPVSILSGDPDGAVLALSRAEKGRTFFFLCNSSTNALDLVCRFRSEGRFQLWWPYTGRKTGFDGSHLRLEPLESVFVVSGCANALPIERPCVFASSRTLSPERLTIAGKTFANPALVSWTESSDPDVRYFSGTAEYEFRLEDVPAGVCLDLGDVRDVAEVFLDGRRLTSLWYPPYRVELPAVRKGVLTVRVTNGWHNRLVGDERLPPDCVWSSPEKMQNVRNEMQEIGRGLIALPDWVKGIGARPTARKAFSTWNYFTKDSPLQPSGLLGPVQIRE